MDNLKKILTGHLGKDVPGVVGEYSDPIDFFIVEYSKLEIKGEEDLSTPIKTGFFRLLRQFRENYKHKYNIDISVNGKPIPLEELKEPDENTQIIISNGDSAVIYLTNYNQKYIIKHQNILFIGPVSKIGDGFLYNNQHIKDVKFYGLNNVRSIGYAWLSNCGNLADVDFRGLYNLDRVNNGWLSGNQKIKNINFNGLSKLQSVDDYWMRRCGGILETIDFSGLTNLTNVGSFWLYECEMKTINFNGLNNLEKIGAAWLRLCPNLTRVDFTHLTNLKTVGNYALYDGIMKTVLINQDFPQGLRNIIQNSNVTFVIAPRATGGSVRQRPKKSKKKSKKKGNQN